MGEQAIEHRRAQERLLEWVWILIKVGIALYGLLVIGYFLARLVVGERWNLVAFANNFVPWIVAGGVFLCLMALFSRHRWVLIAFQVPGIVAFLVLFGALFLPKGSAEEHADGPELTVATYNGFG